MNNFQAWASPRYCTRISNRKFTFSSIVQVFPCKFTVLKFGFKKEKNLSWWTRGIQKHETSSAEPKGWLTQNQCIANMENTHCIHLKRPVHISEWKSFFYKGKSLRGFCTPSTQLASSKRLVGKLTSIAITQPLAIHYQNTSLSDQLWIASTKPLALHSRPPHS